MTSSWSFSDTFATRRDSYARFGRSNPVISQALTKEMLTNQLNNDGLGVFLRSNGKTLRFMHDGVDAGFDAALTAYAYEGKGAAIMINKNDDGKAVTQIFTAIGEQYHWPDFGISKNK